MTAPKFDAQANHSRWLAGNKAAHEGKPITDCPYGPLEYHYVTWHNGWVIGAHEKAKKDDEL